ncbi:hypothetical protein BSKO_05050 [Bryopsis sp. KO-2023]|nr:hypothetical protein BSKO_05050 [Bryopsis sp. KO-2023]
MSAGLPRDILKWVLSLDLSYQVKNARRDLSNGFLFAEILSRYFPADIRMHSFENVTCTERKTANWHVLDKFFKKHGFHVDSRQIESIAHSKGDAAVKLLCYLHRSLHGGASVRSRTSIEDDATSSGQRAPSQWQNSGPPNQVTLRYGTPRRSDPSILSNNEDEWSPSPIQAPPPQPISNVPRFPVRQNSLAPFGSGFAAYHGNLHEIPDFLPADGPYSLNPARRYSSMPIPQHQPLMLRTHSLQPDFQASRQGSASSHPSIGYLIGQPPEFNGAVEAPAFPGYQGGGDPSFMVGHSAMMGAKFSEEPNLEYDKKPRQVDFKPYTQEDFRAMNYDVKAQKQYWQLGKLGPDLENPEIQEKRSKADRMREYTRRIEEAKRKNTLEQKTLARKPSKRLSIEKSVRERALQFAKSIPRPSIKPSIPPINKQMSAGRGARNVDEQNELEKLDRRHAEQRQKVEAIRKELEKFGNNR